MRYYGDYDFRSLLQEGTEIDDRAQSYPQGIAEGWACTCFAALNGEGDLIFGRNFDWYLHPALILFTDPPGAYASVSMVDISYLGYDKEEPPWTDRKALLDTPYFPFDGLNEYGLAVGIMAVPYADGGEKTVVKCQEGRDSNSFLGQIAQRESLAKAFFVDSAEVVTGRLEEDRLIYPYVEFPSMEDHIAEAIQEGDPSFGREWVDTYVRFLHYKQLFR